MDQMVCKVGKVMKKEFWTTFWAQSVEKVDFFQKLGLALGLGLGLAIEFVKMATFDGADGVQGWESDEKGIVDNVLGPKCGKSGLFSKARVSVRVRVRVRVSYSICENGHFRWT